MSGAWPASIPVRFPCICSQCYETGLMSRYVKSWSTGDTTFWRGPFGDFFYKPNQVSASTPSPQETPPCLASRTMVFRFQAGKLHCSLPEPEPKPKSILGVGHGRRWDGHKETKLPAYALQLSRAAHCLENSYSCIWYSGLLYHQTLRHLSTFTFQL